MKSIIRNCKKSCTLALLYTACLLILLLSITKIYAENTSAQKILIVVSSHNQLGNTGKKTGYYLAELSHPLFVFLDNGYTVDIASPDGGNSPIYSAQYAIR